MSFTPNRQITVNSLDQPDYVPAPQTDPLGYRDGRSHRPPSRNRAPLLLVLLVAGLALAMGGYVVYRLSNWVGSEYADNSTFSSIVRLSLYVLVLAAAMSGALCCFFLAFGLFGSMAKRGLLELPGAFSVHVLDALLGWKRSGVAALASETMARHYSVQDTLAAQSQYRNVTSYSPSINYTFQNRQDALPGPGDALPALLLPPTGPLDLADLQHTPTPQSVLLGMDAAGQRITVPMGKLWHVATAGPTGNGKSNIHRLLLGQLLAMGGNVCIGDPKWTPYDREQDEDWRPIAARLHLAPAATADDIGALLDWASGELQQRLERRRNGQKAGPPLFLAFDELPWIAGNVKGSAEQISELVRLGRGVGMYTLCAAQDFLVKTIGMSGARDNFRSAFYLGGDLKTGSVLLDIPQRALAQQEHRLGVGLALVRSAATMPPVIIRVPYVSNTALYRMLDSTSEATSKPSSTKQPMGFRPARREDGSEDGLEDGRAEHLPAASNAGNRLSPKAARVLALLRQQKTQTDILREVWDIKQASGRAYQEAADELRAILAELAALVEG